MDAELWDLIRDARALHVSSVGKQWLVARSAPVLFFGDLLAYQRSPVRVVTVALNPSRNEFPLDAPFSRFPGADSPDDAQYLAALSEYFRVLPLGWFDNYEVALVGMGASFRAAENVAIHTDVGSVLATDQHGLDCAADTPSTLKRLGRRAYHCGTSSPSTCGLTLCCGQWRRSGLSSSSPGAQ
jgi:hypothetical protein